MKDDPFASLSGLDQRLFQDERTKETTKQRDNETTLSRDNEDASEGAQEVTRAAANDPASVSSSTPAKEREVERARSAGRPTALEATRTPVSSPSGQRRDARVIERHSHDIFYDQIRWMNRLKLEIEENYGEKVTCNGMVQVAVDMLRRDYEANGDDSNLMRQLLFGKPLRGSLGKKAKEVAG